MKYWTGALGPMAIAALVSFGLGQPAAALERGPVCREPTVVDEMTREIRAREYYSQVDPALVTEQPTVDPGVVRCQVCVQATPYDITRFGEQPVRRCVAHDFEVRIVQAGFVVRDLR
jgi:hypothetical protein